MFKITFKKSTQLKTRLRALVREFIDVFATKVRRDPAAWIYVYTNMYYCCIFLVMIVYMISIDPVPKLDNGIGRSKENLLE